MRIAALCVLVAVAPLVRPAGAHAVELDSDTRGRIDRLARPMIEKGVAVGFVIGVLNRGETSFLSYGETTRGSGRVPDADTVYEIGSITKVFTGLLLADAVLGEEVELDDPVQKYLPRDAALPQKGEAITLEHLATHTSGLPRLPPNLTPIPAENPYSAYTAQDLHAALPLVELERSPGEYAYSNFGMGLLGHALARRAGTAYEDLLRERVLRPLGLSDTAIRLDDAQRARFATPYAAGLEAASPWDLPALPGAGALRSTARDMLRFAAAALDRRPEAPLARAFASSMERRVGIPGGLAVGLGWHIAADGSTRWHDGGTGGFRSWIAVLPERDLAVVMLANTADERLGRFAEDVTRAAAGVAVEPQEIPSEIEIDAQTLERYRGTYELAPTFSLTVSVENGQLMVQATGQDAYPVFPSAPHEFFYKVVDARLRFVEGPDGTIEKVVLHQNGQSIEGRRRR